MAAFRGRVDAGNRLLRRFSLGRLVVELIRRGEGNQKSKTKFGEFFTYFKQHFLHVLDKLLLIDFTDVRKGFIDAYFNKRSVEFRREKTSFITYLKRHLTEDVGSLCLKVVLSKHM